MTLHYIASRRRRLLRVIVQLGALLLVASLVVLLLGALGFGLRHREGEALAQAWVRSAAPLRIDLRPEVYAELPPPVRRYFDYAFQGQTEILVSHVTWNERGDFRLPVGAFSVRGGQASRPQTPVYTWTGTFWKGPFPLLESRDAFRIDTHDMRARLFGGPKVMHTDYVQNEERASLYSYLTLRYYGQAPLMPWALLPNPYVRWAARDDTSAWLVLQTPTLAGRYLVTFSPQGGIRQMDIDRMLIEGNGVYQQEAGLKLDYQKVKGFMVPTRMDYRWTPAEDGAVMSHYAFRVEDVTYHVTPRP